MEDVNNFLNQFNELEEIWDDEKFFTHIQKLHNHHYKNCEGYRKFINLKFPKSIEINKLENLPYLPVELFKKFKLFSCKKENIIKIMMSSGTSGQTPSLIHLDKSNIRNQTIGLSKIFSSFTNLKRPNILIVDIPSLIKNRSKFNARVAGIVGFSSLCRHSFYAFDDELNLNLKEIENCIEKSKGEKILIFGFTSIIWEHFLKNPLPSRIKNYLKENSILLHGGGWKKLEKISVSRDEFNFKIAQNLGTEKVINYYGMIEQTGSIFMECEKGYLHSNSLCSIISRSLNGFKINKNNEIGLAQVISALPSSYPGHSLLTDDLVEIFHNNNCPCKRPGIAFKIHGRLKTAEIRGCSDTLQI